MKTYDVYCPVCGFMNKKLYLEETEGWMECEICGHLHHISKRFRVTDFILPAIRPQAAGAACGGSSAAG